MRKVGFVLSHPFCVFKLKLSVLFFLNKNKLQIKTKNQNRCRHSREAVDKPGNAGHISLHSFVYFLWSPFIWINAILSLLL